MKKTYKAEIEKDSKNPNIIRQIFTATLINIEEEEEMIYIQFAENIDNTTIHSLLFSVPNENAEEENGLYAEFNDQVNGMFGKQIGTIELTSKNLILSPSMDRLLCAGRVSYLPEADPFNKDASFFNIKINQILVKHNAEIELLSRLDLLFQGFSKYGIVYLSKL